MSAYLVISGTISDPQKFRLYAVEAARLVAEMGGEYLVRGGQTQLLEGKWNTENKMVISKWPSPEAALRFWNSPEYRRAAEIRKDIGDFTVVLVEGAEPE